MTSDTGAMTVLAVHERYAAGAPPAEVLNAAYAAIAAADDPGIFIALRPLADVVAEAGRLPTFDPVRFPLWGIPCAVKDNIDVAGLPTTCACPAFAYLPTTDATAVARLRAAGALVLGKTNLDQFATGLVGVRTPYPIPRNAIDPALVPGGSSSGSAVAVSRGLVAFALGTDTAGSGRVPAGLNNIVGLKPSVGAVSSIGMVPACRTLDCISVFAGTVDDAWRVFDVMAGDDPADPYARPIASAPLTDPPPTLRIGIPRPADRMFFGDTIAEAAFEASLGYLRALGAKLVDVDMTPYFAAAALLYDGAWVAERHAAMRAVLATHADDVFPVTRRIVESATRFSATDLFEAQYKLADLRRQTAPVWQSIDMMAVPTTPHAPTRAMLEADPLRPNAELGTYTNFVNLLDLAALAVPGPRRTDGRAAGVTLIGPRGSDSRLASFGRVVHAAVGGTIGATGHPVPPLPAVPKRAPVDRIEIAVVGAHLSGMALNAELIRTGGIFLREVRTEPSYRLFALPGGPPKRPALLRVAAGGTAIATEVWALAPADFARFVDHIPAPLGLGTLLLADGTRPKGFLAEALGTVDAEDISRYGGWRRYIAEREGPRG